MPTLAEILAGQSLPSEHPGIGERSPRRSSGVTGSWELEDNPVARTWGELQRGELQQRMAREARAAAYRFGLPLAAASVAAISVPTWPVVAPAVAGAIGGYLGSLAAQREEVESGERERVSQRLALGEAAASGIPAVPAARFVGKPVLRAAEGVVQGLLGQTAYSVVGEGRAPSAGELAFGSIVGGALGGGIGAWERRAVQDATKALRAKRVHVARKVAKTHESNGGSTYRLDGTDLGGTENYSVSIFPDRSEILDRPPKDEDILRYVQRNEDIFRDPRVALGTWFDKESGKHYLDASVAIPDLQQAIKLGKEYNQISIFNLKTFEEIPIGGTGQPIPNMPPAHQRLAGVPRAKAPWIKKIDQWADDAERRLSRFSSTVMSGIPFDKSPDVALVAARAVVRGADTLDKFSNQMLDRFGEAIQPYLQKIHKKAINFVQNKIKLTKGELQNTRKLIELFKAGENPTEWYAPTVRELTPIFGEDTDTFIRILAATSPTLSVEENITAALKAYAQWKTGQPFTGYLFTPTVKAARRETAKKVALQERLTGKPVGIRTVRTKAGKRVQVPDVPKNVRSDFDPATDMSIDVAGNLERAIMGEDYGGPKVQNFLAALRGDPNAVVIDRWMMRALGFGKKKEAPRDPAEYNFLVEIFRGAAEEAGVTPAFFQENLWRGIKRTAGQKSATGELRYTEKSFVEVLKSRFKSGKLLSDRVQAQLSVAEKQILSELQELVRGLGDTVSANPFGVATKYSSKLVMLGSIKMLKGVISVGEWAREMTAASGLRLGNRWRLYYNRARSLALNIGSMFKRNQVGQEPAAPPMKLEHYSTLKDMTQVDPAFHGKGLAGAEARRKRNDSANWVDRSYFYVAGTEPEAQFRQQNRFRVETPPGAKIYDMAADPEGLMAKARNEYGYLNLNLYERLIKEAGYFGFTNPKSPIPNAVALFYPVNVVKEAATPPPLAARHSPAMRAAEAVQSTESSAPAAKPIQGSGTEGEQYWVRSKQPPKTPNAGPMPAGRINVEMYERVFGKEQGRVFYEVAQAHSDEIAKQTRGVQHQERMQALADTVHFLKKKLPPGTALNDYQTKALIDTVAGLQGELESLQAQLRQADLSPGQRQDLQIQLSETYAAWQVAHTNMMGTRSEQGRALGTWRFLARARQSNDALFLQKAKQMGIDPDRITEILATANTADERYKMLKNMQKMRPTDYIRWWWYTSLLSHPVTHERNLVGNAVNVAMRLARSPLGAGYDALAAKALGREREMFFGEFPAEIVGLLEGLPKAVANAKRVLKTGFTEADVEAMRVTPEVFGGFPILGGIFNWTRRSLGAGDQFFRALNFQMEKHAAAFATARKSAMREKFSGQGLRDETATRMAEYLSKDPDWLMDRATAAGARGVFEEPGGTAMRMMMRLRQAYPTVTMFIMPFLRIPANLLKRGMQVTPGVGAIMAAREVDPRIRAQKNAEHVLGLALSAGFAALAMNGRLSGRGPTDPAERDRLMEKGWQPESIKIGGRWYSYQNTPFAIPASMIGNGWEAMEELRDKKTWRAQQRTVADQMMVGLVKTVQSWANQSFVSGVSDLMTMLREPDWAAEQWAGRFFSSAIGFAGARRALVQTGIPGVVEPDITVRRPLTIGERVRADIPGLSTTVRPRLTAWGEEAQRKAHPLDPFKSSTEVPDRIREELATLDIEIRPPWQTELSIKGRRYPIADESNVLQLNQAKGQVANLFLTKLLGSPRWAQLTDDQKRMTVSRFRSQANRLVGGWATRTLLQGQDLDANEIVKYAERRLGGR